jgi:DNA modification methylase
MNKTRPELTFKHNQKNQRHNWLRLTPAYSVKTVNQILETLPTVHYVLDPFAGTSTTGLVCAELGLKCDLFDINPFLVWFGQVKTQNYTCSQIQETRNTVTPIKEYVNDNQASSYWLPPISDINKWWTTEKLKLLGLLYQAILQQDHLSKSAKNLLLVAFCKLVIEWSNAAFNHQSMSFKTPVQTLPLFSSPLFLLDEFETAVYKLTNEVEKPLFNEINIYQVDARYMPNPISAKYDCVITSPPYPNRVSYIRELRPYMYWLGYLSEAREAGELDWQAIGGTWGVATSRLTKWQPDIHNITFPDFYNLITSIAQKSITLANYVHKYFVDIDTHLKSLYLILKSKAKIFYIVGNSKFYDTVVPVEEIYRHMMQEAGFTNVSINYLRKRNSKKELHEYMVSAEKV